MLELQAVDEGAVPASALATSRLFVLPVATRRWVLTDNKCLVVLQALVELSEQSAQELAEGSTAISRVAELEAKVAELEA